MSHSLGFLNFSSSAVNTIYQHTRSYGDTNCSCTMYHSYNKNALNSDVAIDANAVLTFNLNITGTKVSASNLSSVRLNMNAATGSVVATTPPLISVKNTHTSCLCPYPSGTYNNILDVRIDEKGLVHSITTTKKSLLEDVQQPAEAPAAPPAPAPAAPPAPAPAEPTWSRKISGGTIIPTLPVLIKDEDDDKFYTAEIRSRIKSKGYGMDLTLTDTGSGMSVVLTLPSWDICHNNVTAATAKGEISNYITTDKYIYLQLNITDVAKPTAGTSWNQEYRDSPTKWGADDSVMMIQITKSIGISSATVKASPFQSIYYSSDVSANGDPHQLTRDGSCDKCDGAATTLWDASTNPLSCCQRVKKCSGPECFSTSLYHFADDIFFTDQSGDNLFGLGGGYPAKVYTPIDVTDCSGDCSGCTSNCTSGGCAGGCFWWSDYLPCNAKCSSKCMWQSWVGCQGTNADADRRTTRYTYGPAISPLLSMYDMSGDGGLPPQANNLLAPVSPPDPYDKLWQDLLSSNYPIDNSLGRPYPTMGWGNLSGIYNAVWHNDDVFMRTDMAAPFNRPWNSSGRRLADNPFPAGTSIGGPWIGGGFPPLPVTFAFDLNPGSMDDLIWGIGLVDWQAPPRYKDRKAVLKMLQVEYTTPPNGSNKEWFVMQTRASFLTDLSAHTLGGSGVPRTLTDFKECWTAAHQQDNSLDMSGEVCMPSPHGSCLPPCSTTTAAGYPGLTTQDIEKARRVSGCYLSRYTLNIGGADPSGQWSVMPVPGTGDSEPNFRLLTRTHMPQNVDSSGGPVFGTLYNMAGTGSVAWFDAAGATYTDSARSVTTLLDISDSPMAPGTVFGTIIDGEVDSKYYYINSSATRLFSLPINDISDGYSGNEGFGELALESDIHGAANIYGTANYYQDCLIPYPYGSDIGRALSISYQLSYEIEYVGVWLGTESNAFLTKLLDWPITSLPNSDYPSFFKTIKEEEGSSIYIVGMLPDASDNRFPLFLSKIEATTTTTYTTLTSAITNTLKAPIQWMNVSEDGEYLIYGTYSASDVSSSCVGVSVATATIGQTGINPVRFEFPLADTPTANKAIDKDVSSNGVMSDKKKNNYKRKPWEKNAPVLSNDGLYIYFNALNDGSNNAVIYKILNPMHSVCPDPSGQGLPVITGNNDVICCDSSGVRVDGSGCTAQGPGTCYLKSNNNRCPDMSACVFSI